MLWENGPLTVYHGTDEDSAAAILLGIDLSLCRDIEVDFGQGFYLTSLLPEAWHWAQIRASEKRTTPRVLAFDLDREEAAKLGDHLTFTLASEDFFAFVAYNRRGSRHHARLGDPAADPPVPPRHYDLVYGPVSQYPARTPMPGFDQICCLSKQAVNCLKRVRYEAAGSP